MVVCVLGACIEFVIAMLRPRRCLMRSRGACDGWAKICLVLSHSGHLPNKYVSPHLKALVRYLREALASLRY